MDTIGHQMKTPIMCTTIGSCINPTRSSPIEDSQTDKIAGRNCLHSQFFVVIVKNDGNRRGKIARGQNRIPSCYLLLKQHMQNSGAVCARVWVRLFIPTILGRACRYKKRKTDESFKRASRSQAATGSSRSSGSTSSIITQMKNCRLSLLNLIYELVLPV